jgi:hypothetical protein
VLYETSGCFNDVDAAEVRCRGQRWQRCECLACGLTSTEVTSEVTDLECTMVRGSLRAWAST